MDETKDETTWARLTRGYPFHPWQHELPTGSDTIRPMATVQEWFVSTKLCICPDALFISVDSGRLAAISPWLHITPERLTWSPGCHHTAGPPRRRVPITASTGCWP
jgi:hypothetical protein